MRVVAEKVFFGHSDGGHALARPASEPARTVEQFHPPPHALAGQRDHHVLLRDKVLVDSPLGILGGLGKAVHAEPGVSIRDDEPTREGEKLVLPAAELTLPAFLALHGVIRNPENFYPAF